MENLMMDKPDHKHTRRIFIHPHTGDKQAKQVLQTILTNAGLGMSKSNKLATDNVRQAKLPRCTDEAHVPCDLNLYINIPGMNGIYWLCSPNQNLSPAMGWFEEKESLSKPSWYVGNLLMVPKLLSIMIHHGISDTPSALHGALPTTGSWLLIDLRKNTCMYPSLA